MKRIGVLAAAAAALWATGASALVEVQLRGGWADTVEEFPFARVNNEDVLAETAYGSGGFGEADVRLDALFMGLGVEAGVDFALFDNEDAFGEAEPNSTGCSTETFLGLIDDCHERVDVQADTQIITADLLLTKDLLAGLRAALGATGLFLDSELDADHIFPAGFESFVDRDTSLDAYGVKAGFEHALPLINTGLTLYTELYGSWVWGERSVAINDFRTSGGVFFEESFLLIEDDIDVPVVDATVALSWKLTGAASIEVGGRYRRLFGAMFTSQTDGEDVAGSDAADIDYWTVFGGVKFSL